jgi:hypothetical protein
VTNKTLAVAMTLGLISSSAGAADRLAVSWNESGSGRVRLMDTQSPWSFVNSAITTDPNATLRYAHGLLFVVSRTAGTVKVINVSTWTVVTTISISLQNLGDLRDIAAVDSSLAYLTEENSMQLIRLNLTTGAATRVVDMSGFSTACGSALDRMQIHGRRLFVQVGTASTHWNERGCLGVVNMATEQLVDAVPMTIPVDPITLSGTQGKAKMRVIPADPLSSFDVDKLFVSASGSFFDDDAGLEVVNLNGLYSLGVLVEEDGTDFRGFALLDTLSGFISDGTDLTLSSHLFMFDNGQIQNLQYDVPGYESPWLEVASGYLFFPDGGPNQPGVAVFEVSSGDYEATTATAGEPTDIELVP